MQVGFDASNAPEIRVHNKTNNTWYHESLAPLNQSTNIKTLSSKQYTYESASSTLSTTKYGDYYYAEITPSESVDNIVGIVVTSSSGNNFATAQITGTKIRVYGTVSGGSVGIRITYKH